MISSLRYSRSISEWRWYISANNNQLGPVVFIRRKPPQKISLKTDPSKFGHWEVVINSVKFPVRCDILGLSDQIKFEENREFTNTALTAALQKSRKVPDLMELLKKI